MCIRDRCTQIRANVFLAFQVQGVVMERYMCSMVIGEVESSQTMCILVEITLVNPVWEDFTANVKMDIRDRSAKLVIGSIDIQTKMI
eukprot:TRINITY_DN13398_c0_g1_i1.p2 TRINITY_DN13398_c0_g1~~TRINITY_DN13398_c0_g1_i1.p2  ORF type:complete len:101 (-),score=17.56 TRINITY_DN13398_c0_g1_i1:225-485(-)